MSEILDTIEETLDVVDMTQDQLDMMLRAHKAQLFVVAVVSAGAAATATYFLVKNRFKTHYEEIANEEIMEANRRRPILQKEGEFSDPEVLAAPYRDKVESLGYVPKEDLVTETAHEKARRRIEKAPETVVSVFDQSDQIDLDMNREAELRNGDRPYVISMEEFFTNEDEFEQVAVTLYEEDDVIADDAKQPMPDAEELIGSENLVRFGHGSGDINTVYVRNVEKGMDFEVTRFEGSYEQHILGLKHEDSRRRRPRRARDGDDE